MYSLRPGDPMEAFLVSTSLVALAEMGDKTQLLSLLLATRFRRPWPIALGILVATLVNHTLAAALGSSLREWVGEQMLRFVVAAGFLGMAAWVLIPDKLDARSTPRGSHGVFATTAIAFFVAEMGDKTQIVTAALGARYSALFVVVLGTTFGMLLANVPVVFLGERFSARLPMRLLRSLAAASCLLLGALVYFA
jgi:putative Ca2+/H+ antiporter (TMEM165/GDT1 family)